MNRFHSQLYKDFLPQIKSYLEGRKIGFPYEVYLRDQQPS